MQGIGLPHIIILLVVILIFFGPSRLPALGQSIGKAIRGFKDGLNEIDAESKDVGPQSQINHAQKNTDAQTAEEKANSKKS